MFILGQVNALMMNLNFETKKYTFIQGLEVAQYFIVYLEQLS